MLWKTIWISNRKTCTFANNKAHRNKMKCTDLTEYELVFKKPTKLLQRRGILESDLLDLPCNIANKFNLNYCDYGVSLCLYEPFTESSSFFAFLLVKKKSVLLDEDVQNHESIYKSENDELWTNLSNAEGREIKEFISFDEMCKESLNQFIHFVHSCLIHDSSIYYWIKLDELTFNIPLIIEKLKDYGINAVSMSNDANILVLTAE